MKLGFIDLEEKVMGTRQRSATIDPVCGMQVESEHAAGTSDYNGEVISFYSLWCKQQFDREPEWYVGAKAR